MQSNSLVGKILITAFVGMPTNLANCFASPTQVQWKNLTPSKKKIK